jgi:hypothetical protein
MANDGGKVLTPGSDMPERTSPATPVEYYREKTDFLSSFTLAFCRINFYCSCGRDHTILEKNQMKVKVPVNYLFSQ